MRVETLVVGNDKSVTGKLKYWLTICHGSHGLCLISRHDDFIIFLMLFCFMLHLLFRDSISGWDVSLRIFLNVFLIYKRWVVKFMVYKLFRRYCILVNPHTSYWAVVPLVIRCYSDALSPYFIKFFCFADFDNLDCNWHKFEKVECLRLNNNNIRE